MFLTSCNNEVYFQETIDLPESGWKYDEPLEFSFDIQDTTLLSDIILDVDHSIDFGYQNMYTNIYTVFPAGDTTSSVVSLDLTDKNGKWAGNCKGSECSLQITLRERTLFPKRGQYKIILDQYSRNSSITGIKNFGLIIKKSG